MNRKEFNLRYGLISAVIGALALIFFNGLVMMSKLTETDALFASLLISVIPAYLIFIGVRMTRL